jgi:hypothetical protein
LRRGVGAEPGNQTPGAGSWNEGAHVEFDSRSRRDPERLARGRGAERRIPREQAIQRKRAPRSGVPAADVPLSTSRGGCDPCQGREHVSRITGGVVALLLNHRLMAPDPSGMCLKIRVETMGFVPCPLQGPLSALLASPSPRTAISRHTPLQFPDQGLSMRGSMPRAWQKLLQRKKRNGGPNGIRKIWKA